MPELKKPKILRFTFHSRAKMRHYGFSEARVKRVINCPNRIEDGIAPKTVAFMQKAGNEKHPYEVWTMIQDVGSNRKIISAWRYPGVTKPRSEATKFILKQELDNFLKQDEEKRDKGINNFNNKNKRSKWFGRRKSNDLVP